MRSSLVDLYDHRELLRNFLSRDLRVRYKGSALGMVWSLLNPLVMMLVYTLAFSVVMRNNIPNFPVFFMSAFLPWTFFAGSLQMGSSSLLAHSSLIQKVYFPREVLPLSVTIANLVNMGLAFLVLAPYALLTEGVSPLGVLTLIPVTVALFLFASGAATLLSAVTVYFRDVEFLLGLVLTAWFFLTPVVYGADQIPPRLRPVLELNPVVPFVLAYRDVIYGTHAPSLLRVAACIVIGTGAFAAGYALFRRVNRKVVEEL